MRMASVFFIAVFSGVCAGGEPAWLLACSVRTEHRVREGASTLHQYGSGTVIRCDASGLVVLTCAHNFVDGGRVACGEVYVRLGSGREVRGRVLRCDVGEDLALVGVRAADVPRGEAVGVARLARTEVYRAGTRVIKCGYPGAERSVGIGKLEKWKSETKRNGRWCSNAVLALGARTGDSGCGVFRESDRRLIGVLWGGAGGTARAVRLADIRRFLSGAAKGDSALASLADL